MKTLEAPGLDVIESEEQCILIQFCMYFIILTIPCGYYYVMVIPCLCGIIA